MTITIKNEAEIAGMRVAGRLAAEVLDMIAPHMKPGVTTERSTARPRSHRPRAGCHSGAAQLRPPGYTPYPKSICTSINHQVCHGIPNDRPLKNGDIVNVDVTVIKDGWHGDTSRMYIVGEGSIAAKRLVQKTYEAMWKGIVRYGRRPSRRHRQRDPGLRRGERALDRARVLRPRIGQRFHEEPQVLHYGKRARSTS
jgi:methionyl aminopeptidase